MFNFRENFRLAQFITHLDILIISEIKGKKCYRTGLDWIFPSIFIDKKSEVHGRQSNNKFSVTRKLDKLHMPGRTEEGRMLVFHLPTRLRHILVRTA